MIKLETHLHVGGASWCASATPKDIVQDYFNAGYGGIVVTNHHHVYNYTEFSGTTHKEKTDQYFSFYKSVKEEADKVGLKTFFGVEVRTKTEEDEFQEFMLYGFEEDFLYNNKPLFNYNQKQLFEIAQKHGLFMYQTHPFRMTSVGLVKLGDPKFMHGAEGYNGHDGHIKDFQDGNQTAWEFCKKNNLITMAGSDYHHAGQGANAGIYIPENICTNEQLKNYIMQNNFELYIKEQGK